MKLAPHTTANREFFVPRRGPSKDVWADWIRREIVQGKIIDDKPYIDLNWFAASGSTLRAPIKASDRITGLDLLRAGANT